MTKDFVESLAEIVADVSSKHIGDINAAVDECERRVKRLPEFNDFIGELVRQALREQIYDWRHKANTQQRKASGAYGGQAIVASASSDAVQEVASEKSLYDYFLAGTTVGMLTGEQLLATADSEATKADGHRFNAELCRRLAKFVAPDKTVRDCVTETKLLATWKAASKAASRGKA